MASKGDIITIIEQLEDGTPRVTVVKITRVGTKYVYGNPVVREEGKVTVLPYEVRWRLGKIGVLKGERWELVDKEMQYRRELALWNERRSSYYREVSREEYNKYARAVALKMADWDRDNPQPKNPFAGEQQ